MPRTLLLATDYKQSVITEVGDAKPSSIRYCAYGQPSATQAIATRLAFNGAFCEKSLGWFFLGNGYRIYNPVLRCFHSPDSWSPFGLGGLNMYSYCGGDPINYSDPLGHMRSGNFKLPVIGSRRVERSSSSSSLSPLLQNAVEPPISSPIATAHTIPALTREVRILTERRDTRVETIVDPSGGVISRSNVVTWSDTNPVTAQNYTDYGPPRIKPWGPPSKKSITPRFNDTGGEVMTSNSQLWFKEPFEFPAGPAPLPGIRTSANGVSHHYSMTFPEGRIAWGRVEKVNLADFQQRIREQRK